MRIVALTFGTEGDTRPMLALCRGLLDEGHDVVVLAERSGEVFAAALGVPFVALAGDMVHEMESAGSDLLPRGDDVKRVARALSDIATRHTKDWMRATLAHVRGADAILCAGLAIYVGLSCAEALHVVPIGIALQPMMPTRAFASPFLPMRRLPKLLNRASHRLVLAMMWRAFRGAINDARHDIANQPPRRREWHGYPILFGMSPTLVPRPPDWPARFTITGDWWFRAETYAPDSALETFLAEGDAPIYVGFGSMTGFDRRRLLASVLDTLDGRRALLSAGWSGFGEAALPPNVRRIDHVPHGWLLPRVRLAVHHGGAGTTHAAAHAGVPSVVVPFAADQFFWADRLRALGIAPARLAYRDVTAAALGERIAVASEDRMRDRARHIGRAMADERGVANAVARIGALLSAA
ncbi:MAG TPA: glycosyltransferase [Casimicrobiaceae bacterium]